MFIILSSDPVTGVLFVTDTVTDAITEITDKEY